MSVFAKMSVLSMNKQKLYSIKSNKLLKISAVAFLGACFCVPCIKVDKPSKYALTPRILTIDNINYAYNDDLYNNGVVLTSITYDNVQGQYVGELEGSMNTIFAPYQSSFHIALYFNYTSTGAVHLNELAYIGTEINNVFYSYNVYIDYDDNYLVQMNYSFDKDNHGTDFSISYVNAGGTQPLTTIQDDDTFLPNIPVGSYNGGTLLNLRELLGDNPESYQQGVSYGIQYVLDHLADYGLYTTQQYLDYGAQQYAIGLENAGETLSLGGLIHEIFKAPITMFQGIFNWSITLPSGEVINVLPIMTFLLTIGIALAIVNLIMRIK